MSRSSLNSPSSASTDALMLATRPVTPGSRLRSESAAAMRPSACSGWRRSWFAAAKNCVFERFAASAWARAASAISFCRDSASISSTFSNRRRIASSTRRFTLRPNISPITSVMPSGNRERDLLLVAGREAPDHERREHEHDQRVERRREDRDRRDRERHDAEQDQREIGLLDDLVGDVEEDAARAPDQAGDDRRADVEPPPARRLRRAGLRSQVRAVVVDANRLVQEQRGRPRRDHADRHLVPRHPDEERAGDERTERRRRRVEVHGADLLGADLHAERPVVRGRGRSHGRA